MERRHLGIALLIIASLGSAVRADSGVLDVAGHMGSLGFGRELTMNPLPEINDRFGATYLPPAVEGEIGGVNYEFNLRVLTLPLTMGWYPFHNGFHVSGGLIFNQSRMDLDTGSSASLPLGDTSYSAAELGTVRGRTTFRHLAPYVEIGWNNAFGKDGRWGFVTNLGVAFLGRPHVSLTATGPIASDVAFQGDLTQAEQDAEDDLSDLQFYPIFSISLFYRF